jgi:hypothetical protein
VPPWARNPIRTIGREELKAKVDRRDNFKLILALNRWAFDAKHIPGSLPFDTPDALYAAVKPDDDVVSRVVPDWRSYARRRQS